MEVVQGEIRLRQNQEKDSPCYEKAFAIKF